MHSLPPIRPLGSDPSNAAAANFDVHSPDSAANITTASAADGINRNQLRQEAGRRVQHITRGVADQQTYLNMLQHIREQFAHTSQEPLQPLVLPPQWPSTARPREPQTAKFSRGIALAKSLQRRSDVTLPAIVSGHDGAAADTRAGSLTSPADGTVAATETGAASTASYVPTELPSTSTAFAHAHRWEGTDTEGRSFFHRRLRPSTSVDSPGLAEGRVGSYASSEVLPEPDLSPLDELPTLEEKIAYLSQLETASRQHVLAYERWDQQVISEMMAVRYVTFVLKPCMDALRMEETEERAKICQSEDHVSFFMFHESPLVLAIEEGIKAMKARELQLDRILGVNTAPNRRTAAPSPPSTRAPPQLPPPVPRDSFDTGREESSDAFREDTEWSRPHSSYAASRPPKPPASVSGRSSSSYANNDSTMDYQHSTYNNNSNNISNSSGVMAPSTGGGGVSAPDARRILQQYVRQRHGTAIDAAASLPATAATPTKTWTPAGTATYPGPAPTGKDTIRRSSALVLPPLPSAHAPRRNAVGIADYVALLDECMAQRDHIVRSEQQARDDLNRECYEEQQVVLEWQRRRMHLERLMYWRQQRETAVQDEVAALTEVNVGSPLNPKVVLLLEILEGDEESARGALCAEEQQAREAGIGSTAESLLHQHERTQLAAQFADSVALNVWEEEAEACRALVVFEEASRRRCYEDEALSTLQAELRTGLSQLRVLYEVSVSPEQCAALRVLQSSFRQSLRGRLGWRATNAAIGRELNDARNTRKVRAGKRTLQSYKAALEAEAAQLQQEQEAQNIREQQVLFAGEAADRVAVSSEQDLSRQGIRRAAVLHVAEVYRPVFARCVTAEAEARMQLEVEEEVEDEALTRAHAELTRVITRKTRTRYEEASLRKTFVAEERTAWRELLSLEGDCREELRLDIEAQEALRQADRATFEEAAIKASRAYREKAFALYVRNMTEAQLEMLGCDAAYSSERWGIAAEESTAAIALFSSLSLEACEVYGRGLLQQRQGQLHVWQQQAITAAETERRADLLLSEGIEWEMLKPLLMQTLAGPLRDLIVRRGAVNAISTWYTAVRNGDIGRAVSRQRLHDDLARYWDERNLREQQIAQRLHAQQVRDELDGLLREVRQEEAEAVQQRLDILVRREEPRERDQIESMQEIVFGIIVRNGEAQTAAVRRQLVNTEALLWQQESYERKLIVKARRREFQDLMERERLQLSEDYFAGRIQRTWRHYAARKRHEENMAEQRARLSALEQQARRAVELEECESVVLAVQKPSEAALFAYLHAQKSLSLVYEEHCLPLMASTSAQEWQERAALLWEMRYDLCDACLCAEEERARRALLREFHKPLLLQAELVHAESLQRHALMEERGAFLLRLLAREEQTCRRDIAVAEAKRRAAAAEKLSGAEQPFSTEL